MPPKRPTLPSAAHHASKAPAHKAPRDAPRQPRRSNTKARTNTNHATARKPRPTRITPVPRIPRRITPPWPVPVGPRWTGARAKPHRAAATAATTKPISTGTGTAQPSIRRRRAPPPTPHRARSTYGSGGNARSYAGRTVTVEDTATAVRDDDRGYGRSQSNNRAVVARLRSVHSSLARINHDYQGHRVNAMHTRSRWPFGSSRTDPWSLSRLRVHGRGEQQPGHGSETRQSGY